MNKKHAIKQIIKNFNFERVRDAMEHLNWTWAGSKTFSKVPSIKELKKNAKYCLKQAYKGHQKRNIPEKVCSATGTGGFLAHYLEDDGEGYFELIFYLDTWDATFPLPKKKLKKKYNNENKITIQ